MKPLKRQNTLRWKHLGALLVALSAAAGAVRAQQIYFEDLSVRYKLDGSNKTCNSLPGGSLGDDVSSTGFADATGIAGAMIQFANQESNPGGAAPNYTYPGRCLQLCARIRCVNPGTGSSGFGLDNLRFEVFKFLPGTNPLNEESAPPVRTIEFFNIGSCPADTNATGTLIANNNPIAGAGTYFCGPWFGEQNIEGEFGKSNGTYGFRATVRTNQTSPELGNINIETTASYPGVQQEVITVDVTDIHVVRSTPTVVGNFTGVAAQPYNITYRLSKDATMFVDIFDSVNPGGTPIRILLDNVPRVGEGVPSGTLRNGDAWDGRNSNGALVSAGLYLVRMQAKSRDQYNPGAGSYTLDVSSSVIRTLALDPLQITDIRVKSLGATTTDLAVITYVLTEPATAFVDIYPPGTTFADVNVSPPAVNGGVTPVKSIAEQKLGRTDVFSFWDGRDSDGNVVEDGNYVFALHAALPSKDLGGSPFNLRTSRTQVGVITVERGLIKISQVSPTSSVIGSTPAISGLNPFRLSYSLSRPAIVNLKIYDQTGTNVVKRIVINETRNENQSIIESWNGINDDGKFVSSGTYLAELTAADPFIPHKVSTTTALFAVNMFRLTDLNVTSLLSGASDLATISYQLSQTMDTALNVYPPGTKILSSSSTWPPCGDVATSACGNIVGPDDGQISPVHTVRATRPGRFRVTEFWDGRNENGFFVPDGQYVFTIVAKSTTSPAFFITDRVIGTVDVARGQIAFPFFDVTPTIPQLFNSSATVTLPPFEASYILTRQSSVTVQILNTVTPPTLIRTIFSGEIQEGNIIQRAFWDGRDDSGNFVDAGFYTLRVTAQDLASQLITGSTVQQTISMDPLRIFDVAIAPLALNPDTGGLDDALISYQVSEPMKVVIKIYRPGTSFDPSGNPSPPEKFSLIKRFVGVKPARTLIDELWDGTDEALMKVPDGNYLFKIFGSTNPAAIDDITGDVRPGGVLATDVLVDEIPVTRGASLDPSNDAVVNTSMYPNPVPVGGSAVVRVYVPIEADVHVRIYSLGGELVRDLPFSAFSSEVGASKQCGAADSYCIYTWALDNDAGSKLARGVYLLNIRMESTDGQRGVIDFVEKVLIR